MSIFNSIRVKKPKRSAFNLSHEVKLTCDFGELVPFVCQEVLPGDSWKLSAESLVRFAPLKTPMMSRVNVYTHFFFVPNRLLWDSWKDFITGGEDGTAAPVFPTITLKEGCISGTLPDYLGVPTRKGNDKTPRTISALPFRAYWTVFNEYYRDQNLQDPIAFNTASGDWPVTSSWDILKLQKRAWAKDYFTSALPWPQRLPDNQVPKVPMSQGDVNVVLADRTKTPIWERASGDTGSIPSLSPIVRGAAGQSRFGSVSSSGVSDTGHDAIYNPNGTLKARFGSDSEVGFTINDFRNAYSLQRWLENNARGGARYIEQILSHFGVRSSDARLQRPEFLGGGKIPVVVSDVVQTSETSGSSPQGELAGNATAYGLNGATKKRFFEEHGIIIGIMSVMPVAAYQDGLPRFFMKRDKFDFAFPEFAHLGEQEIKNGELYYQGTDEDNEVFGYTPRYAEYRFINSSVHGDFRNSLSQWVLARRFNSLPGLNGTFVQCGDSSLNDVFAVQQSNTDHLWVQMYVKCHAVRPLPKYSTPSL